MTSSFRRSGHRSSAAVLASLALAAGLAGCGSDDSDDTATDPATSSSPTQTPTETAPESPTDPTTEPETGSGGQATIPATGSAGVTEATLVSATEGGGSASTLSFALDTEQAVADFAAQFDAGFGATVSTAASETNQQGATTYGATAVVGCDAPRSVAIEAGEAGFEVTAALPKNTVECLAPVTYVVLFSVPDA